MQHQDATDTIDDYVLSQMQQGIPGISLAVAMNGQLIKSGAYGFSNIELSVPTNLETIYKLGSISKQFIAAGIMLLVEDSKITLEDNITKHIKESPIAWREIKLKHVLTHTSGIVRDSPIFDPYKIQPIFDMIKTTFNLPLSFIPGEKWEYSNVGYFILAEVLNRVCQKSFSDFLQERIFDPSEMQATRTTSVASIIPGRSNSYLRQSGHLYNAGDLLAMRPSGAFVSNVIDLVKWDMALHTCRILTRESREQMETPVKLNDGTDYPYGFGWEIENINGHRLVHHGGALWCFRTEFARFVDDGLTIALFTNYRDSDPRELVLRVANFYIPSLNLSTSATTRLSIKKQLDVFDP